MNIVRYAATIFLELIDIIHSLFAGSQINMIPHIGDECHRGLIAFYSNRTNGRKCCPTAALPTFERPIIDLCTLPFDHASNLTMRVARSMKHRGGREEEKREAKYVASREPVTMLPGHLHTFIKLE